MFPSPFTVAVAVADISSGTLSVNIDSAEVAPTATNLLIDWLRNRSVIVVPDPTEYKFEVCFDQDVPATET